jgi:uncharacterized Fe-S cluster-containing protein
MNINNIICVLNYILFKFYAQTELERLIGLLILNIYFAEQTTKSIFIKYAVQMRDNMYRLLVKYRELKSQLQNISIEKIASKTHKEHMIYLLDLSNRSKLIKYSPDELKGFLQSLKYLINSEQIDEPKLKKFKV